MSVERERVWGAWSRAAVQRRGAGHRDTLASHNLDIIMCVRLEYFMEEFLQFLTSKYNKVLLIVLTSE